jgi:glycosyltransferase involved in cell wall biosynthesis
VVICTHNPRVEYISRVIDALRDQTVRSDEWELLLVDNASNCPVAATVDLAWHPNSRLVREERLGLTAARCRAITETQSDLIVFLDDDNLAAPDYIAEAIATFRGDSSLGVFGSGRIVPEFEIQPQPSLVPRLSMLALRSCKTPLWSTDLRAVDRIPWGAGLCVTRIVANAYRDLVQKTPMVDAVGRRGSLLLAGEDDLFSRVACDLDLTFGVTPSLKVTHLIARGRLTESYFLRLVEGHAFSHCVLDYMFDGIEPAPVGVRDYVRLVAHGARRGIFSMRCRSSEIRGRRFARRQIAAGQFPRINRADEGLSVVPRAVPTSDAQEVMNV